MLPYYGTKLTIELRDLINDGVKLWDFEYPSYYKGEEKTAFEQKVIDHFYFRQIGSETVGRFLHQFRTKVREIMPLYIQYYKSVEIMNGIEDPFGNVDIKETFEQESTEQSEGRNTGKANASGTNTDTRNGSNDHEQKFSDTPQGSVQNLSDGFLTNHTKDHVTSQDNVTSENENEASSEGTSEESKTGTLKHTFTKKGNQGVNTYAHDMIEFRTSFIDVDMMIINELNPLFLGVY